MNTQAVTTDQHTKFSHPSLPCLVLKAGNERYLSGRCLIVNFNPISLNLNNKSKTQLFPFTSLIRCNESITPQLDCLLFELPSSIISGQKTKWDDQERYTGMRINDANIQEIDFFRSKQDETAFLSFPPQQLTAGSDIDYDRKKFKLCTNLWFAEPGTHCGIHNKHSFIEIHAQILGVGCMQTFHNSERDTLCEDFIMAPGTTTSQAFCHIKDNQFIYPYHQYYAETPCVWLALEYHPL